jgi:hypothetical protein
MGIPNRHNTLLKLSAWLLCMLFVMQIINRSAYIHTHLDANGSVISHAHPYDKSSDTGPYKKHHHSASEFALLAHWEVLFLLAFILFACIDISPIKKYNLFTKQVFHSRYTFRNPGRSPPMVLSI